MEQIIKDIEEKDGVRLTWNIWGTKGMESSRIPLACLYNIHQKCNIMECEPIYCATCRSILNPHCPLDFDRHTWTCVLCKAINTLPSHARDITENNLLPELMEENTTIEYVLSKESVFAPIFFFVVDICTFDEERHKILIEALQATFERIPDDSLVGFIQFGTNIELLELNKTKPKKIYLFSGQTEYDAKKLSGLIGYSNKKDTCILGKYLMKKEECKDFLQDIIANLKRDPFPVLTSYKPVRCTGSALSLAVSLLESNFANSAVKYLLFTQGPCTYGPGTVTSIKYKEKSKNEFFDDSDDAYSSSANKYYTSLGNRVADLGHCVDILATTIEDIGINHMERLVGLTGGILIMAQDFDPKVYISSCIKTLSGDEYLDVGFNAKTLVKTSENVKFNGVLGLGKSSNVGWRLGCLYPNTNISILLSETKEAKHEEFGYVQIITQYQRSDKKLVVKVTSFARMFSDSRIDVVNGFDQEAVAVFQARYLLLKKYEEVKDCERMIDKSLIRFTKFFSQFSKGMNTSLELPESMSYYPNYMFFFGRSLLVQTENCSKDENVYFKNLLNREKVGDALKLIKPILISFHYQGEIKPVELDTKSLENDVILVLDSFHNVVVWRGEYIDQWIKEGYHEQKEYEFLKSAIEQSESLAQEMCQRLPTPQFCITGANKSQQRILHHYVNPSGPGVVITESISYEKFFEALSKVVVSIDD